MSQGRKVCGFDDHLVVRWQILFYLCQCVKENYYLDPKSGATELHLIQVKILFVALENIGLGNVQHI